MIGRDGFIDDLWRILENQSLLLTSPRGIGKTTIIHKMHEDGRDRDVRFSVVRDLASLRTMPEFLDRLYADVERRLGGAETGRSRFWGLLATMGGAQISDLRLPHIGRYWKRLLAALLEDFCQSNSGRSIFFWDELPFFVYNLKQAGGEAAAMEMLDVLRAVRQRHPSIRMVFTGSAALHPMLSGLRRNAFASNPMGDLRTVEVPALEAEHGAQLAAWLVQGEGLGSGPEAGQSAEFISAAAEHIPYYIHSIVARLASGRGGISEAAIHAALTALLSDANDPAHFRSYRERIRTWYPNTESAIALAALDALCQTAEAIPMGELLNRLRSRIRDVNPEVVREVIQELAADQYVRRTDQGLWGFRYEIVRQWWKLDER